MSSKSLMVKIKGKIKDLQAKLKKAKSLIRDFSEESSAKLKTLGAINIGATGMGDLGIAQALRNVKGGLEINKWWEDALLPSETPDLSGVQKMIGNITGKVNSWLQKMFLMDQPSALDFGLGKTLKMLQGKAVKAFKNVTKPIKSMGKWLGKTAKAAEWFSFKVYMMGYMLNRWLDKGLKSVIGRFKTWDKTVRDIGTSLGFLASAGMLTGASQESMISAMSGLPKVGMMLQGVMGQLSALFVNIGNDVLPILLPAISNLITAFTELWKANKDKIIPVFEDIGERINEIATIFEDEEGAGADFLVNLVEGLRTAVTWIRNMLTFLKDKGLLGAVGRFLGALVGLSPVLLALGAAGMIVFGILGAIAGALSTTAGVIIAALVVAIAIAIVAIKKFRQMWENNFLGIKDKFIWLKNKIGSIINSIVGIMIFLGRKVVGVGENIKGGIDAIIEGFRGLVDKIKGWFTGDSVGSWIADNIDTAISALTSLLNPIENVKDKMQGWMNKAKSWFGNSIGDDIKVQMDMADESFKETSKQTSELAQEMHDLQKSALSVDADYSTELAFSALRGDSGRTPNQNTQYIEIDVEVNIDSVASDVDIDTLTDAISKEIADRTIDI